MITSTTAVSSGTACYPPLWFPANPPSFLFFPKYIRQQRRAWFNSSLLLLIELQAQFMVLQAKFHLHLIYITTPGLRPRVLLSCPIDSSEVKNPWAVESRSLSSNHPASNLCERASMSSWYQTCASSMPAENPKFSCGWIYRWDVWFLAGPCQHALIRGSLWDEGGRFCPWLLCVQLEFVLKRKIKMQRGERQNDKGATPKPDFYSIVESSHPKSFALKSHLLSLMNPSRQPWLNWYYLFWWECHDSQFDRGMWDLRKVCRPCGH